MLEPAPRSTDFDRDSQRAAEALFGAKSAVLDPVAAPTPAGFKGRILPKSTEFDRDSQRAAEALFGAKSAVLDPVAAPTPAGPKGRILPSLVVDPPPDAAAYDDQESTPETGRGSRATRTDVDPPMMKPRGRPAGKRQAPSPGATHLPVEALEIPGLPDRPVVPERVASFEPASEPSKPPAPPRATDLPVKTVEGPALRDRSSTRELVASIEPATKRSKAPTPRASAKQPAGRVPMPMSDKQAPASILVDSHSSVSDIGEASPRPRKRMILGRYVFHDELRPGERWKQRLRRTRRGDSA